MFDPWLEKYLLLNNIPKDIINCIYSFVLSRHIDGTFDVRLYPITEELSYEKIAKESAKTMVRMIPYIFYHRMYIHLPTSPKQTFDLVCELDIIDTLIFEPNVDEFYLNGNILRAQNGIYRPVLSTNRAHIQWFFASFQAWLSQVIIHPRPVAIVGGFINRSCRQSFNLYSDTLSYEYESYGSCIISKIS